MMKSIARAAVIGFSLIFNGNASAVTISIDPGDLGETFFSRTFAFTDLNATSFDGSALSLDFVFADRKHLEVTSQQNIEVELFLFHDPAPSTVFGPRATGFLSDESGNSILDLTGAGIGRGVTEYSYLLEHDGFLDAFIFHGLNLNITLPVIDGFSVTGAELQINGDDVPPNQFVVGEWAPSPVPEPGTMILLGLGLAGLSFARRK